MPHPNPEPFELFALHYGHHGGRSGVDNFLGGDPHDSGSDLAYYVWVARRGDRVFVIDTGFDGERAASRGRTLIRHPAEALKGVGIDASKVEDVILSHLHFDHGGTLDSFPTARFHVQDSEVAFATGRCMCHEPLRHPYDVEDIVHIVRCVHQDRVHFHDGAQTLCDGLSIHHVGGHTSGLQVVRVWTRRGWVVLASDAAHLYANFREKRPFPLFASTVEMMEGFRTLHQLADSPDHIIPGHDPLVMQMYEAPSRSLEAVAARLDTAPRKAE